MDAAPGRQLRGKYFGTRYLTFSGQGTGGLHSGGTAADHDDVRVAHLLAVRRIQGGGEGSAQTRGIGHRVQRVGMFLGARGVEEVGDGACGNDEDACLVAGAVGGGDGPGGGIDRRHLGGEDAHAFDTAEHGTQRPGHRRHADLRRRHLVQEGLELMVVVRVNQEYLECPCGRAPRLRSCQQTRRQPR